MQPIAAGREQGAGPASPATSSFADVTASYRERGVLLGVLLELTYRCNLRCEYCSNDRRRRGRPLSLRQHLALLDDLAAMQVLHLVLSGGEPLLHRHFWTIAARARELTFAVRLKSNGHLLGPRVARRLLAEVDPFQVDISVHGATAATHDRQTGLPGSFALLERNLRAASDLGLPVRLVCTLTAWNESELDAILALADSLEAPIVFEPMVTTRDCGDRAPLAIAASDVGVSRLFVRLRERAGRPAEERREEAEARPSGRVCAAGSTMLAIDPYGNVYPCVQWRRKLGNLIQTPLAELWRLSPALSEVRELTARAGEMVASMTSDGRLLAFCPGRAELEAGHPLSIYPAARRRADVLLQLRGT